MIETKIQLKPYQDTFLFSEKRFPCLCAGIGTGKTYMLLLKIWNFCLEYPNSLALIVRQEFTDLHDSTIKDFTRYFNVVPNSNKEYHFENGSVIMFRHGAEVNVLKNINLSIFGIEQAEEFDTEEQFTFLRDRLRRDNAPYQQGCIIANVNGNNWIKRYWKDGELQESLLVEATTFDNEDNLPADFIADLRRMELESPEHYKRYVLNDWTAETEGKVFHNVVNCIAGENREPQEGFQYVMGVDLAKSQDFTVISVLNRQTKHLDYWERSNQVSWNLQKERIKAISEKYHHALVVPDSTGLGDPIVEDLQRAGVGVFYQKDKPGFRFTSINKENLIDKLVVAIEQRLITFPNHEDLIRELESFEYEFTPGKNIRYTPAEGKHDDCVISLALALWGVEGGMYQGYEPPKQPTSADDFWKRVQKDTKRYNWMIKSEREQREVNFEDARTI